MPYLGKVQLKTQVINRTIILFATIFVASCVAVPKSKIVSHGTCKLNTPKWTLEYQENRLLDHCSSTNDEAACLTTLGVVVPVLSTVVSGSIVLVGNTVHWLEYQGNCSREEISKSLEKHKQ